MPTGKLFNLDSVLEGQSVLSYSWLADGVLAVVTDCNGQTIEHPAYDYIQIMSGKQLFVFRISEEFLSVQ
jgi:hypothetical protein